MRAVTIARNYAEALFEVGERTGESERYADLIDAVAAAVQTTPQVQAALMSPRVPKTVKARLLASALQDAPREFVRFLQAVVKRGRQHLLPQIAEEYTTLLDYKLNRLRVGVTLARSPDERLRQEIQQALSAQLGKEVIASFAVDKAILGGSVVRVGERVHDGSVRRKMARLRRQLTK